MDLRGKAAIVTGGGTGLGKAISLRLAAEGTSVGIVYSRSAEEAEATARECAARGVQSLALQADVSRETEVQAMVARAREAFGRIDVLVNNAATTVFRPMSDLEGIDEADWDRLMDVNVKAHWFTARAAAPYLKEHGNGAIVSITSIAGLRPVGSSMPYCVSKAGAIMLAKCLAVALAPQVRVNNVAPGLMRTRWMAGFSDEQVVQFEQSSPLKRGTPIEDVADAVYFAASNDSITGQTIVVDAGIYFH